MDETTTMNPEVDYKKEFTDDEIVEAKKHVKVLADFKEGQTVSFNADGTTNVEEVTEPPKKDDKVGKMLKKELRDRTNVFDQVFVKGYGSRFAQVMNAGIEDRFWLMDSIVSFADQDNDLNDKQRKLIRDLEDAFRDACCMDGPSKRLTDLINKKPNLNKMLKPARLQRTYDTISLPVSRLQFSHVPTGNYIPFFFGSMAVCYGWSRLEFDISFSKSTGMKYPTGMMLAALLSKFANSISPYDYANMWFVLMFVKNLSVCSITSKEVFESTPEIKTYGNNLLKLADHMLDVCGEEILKSNMVQIDNPDGSMYHIKMQSPKDESDNIVEVEI